MTVVIECGYEPVHEHEFPDDWEFGGADGLDWRADSRYKPTTYRYLNSHLDVVWTTQAPMCLDQAIDEFTKHADLGAAYLQVKQTDGSFELVPVEYDRTTDLVKDI